MLNLEELEQLVAFKELGTLSKVAEQFLISTPSLSRSMQHVEEAFGVTLFDRSANRISLNETGSGPSKWLDIFWKRANKAFMK